MKMKKSKTKNEPKFESAEKRAEKREWVLRVPATCDACDGCGKVWILLRGANIQTTEPCGRCWGFGTIIKTVRLSPAESRRVDRVARAHAVDSG